MACGVQLRPRPAVSRRMVGAAAMHSAVSSKISMSSPAITAA
jgi:hypothetical protein